MSESVYEEMLPHVKDILERVENLAKSKGDKIRLQAIELFIRLVELIITLEEQTEERSLLARRVNLDK